MNRLRSLFIFVLIFNRSKSFFDRSNMTDEILLVTDSHNRCIPLFSISKVIKA